MPKAAHLTTVHRPTDVRVFHKEAATLAASGYRVVLIAVADRSYESKGVTVRALRRPRGRVERMTRTAWEAFRAALDERADVYHFHDPELIPLGLLLKARGKRVVYDMHEDVVKDIHDKAYLPGWAKPPVRFFAGLAQRVAISAFDAIVGATPSICAGCPSGKATLVRNVPMLGELAPQSHRDFRDRARRVVYIGGLAPFNGVDQMVRAMAELPADSGVRLTIGGTFNSPADEARVRALPGSDRVDFLGWVDRARIPELLGDARVGIVVYQPTPNVMHSEPNKFFEVLSAGLPLVASNLPHWDRFIREHDCGIAVPPDDPKAIAAAIMTLIDDPDRAEAMGQHGRRAIVEGYNWEAESRTLLALYDRLLENSPTRAVKREDDVTVCAESSPR